MRVLICLAALILFSFTFAHSNWVMVCNRVNASVPLKNLEWLEFHLSTVNGHSHVFNLQPGDCNHIKFSNQPYFLHVKGMESHTERVFYPSTTLPHYHYPFKVKDIPQQSKFIYVSLEKNKSNPYRSSWLI